MQPLIHLPSTKNLLYLERCAQLLRVAVSFQTTIWSYFFLFFFYYIAARGLTLISMLRVKGVGKEKKNDPLRHDLFP